MTRSATLRTIGVPIAAALGLLALPVAAGPAILGLAHRLRAPLRDPSSRPLDQWSAHLVTGALAVVVIAAVWTVALFVVVTAETATGRAPRAGAWWLTPRWMPVLAALLVTGLAAPAYAESAAPHRPGSEPLIGLALPDRPSTGATAHVRTTHQSPPSHPSRPSHDRRVVVRAGDTLWSLARDSLAPGASDTAIDAAWHRLYAANRTTIGPDPDLIHPGLRLTVPGTSTAPALSAPTSGDRP